ncbi:MAG: prolyl oligopeptidase family serine peptidase [Candidatus Kapaibacteriota bacterium]|jgi:dipeptidyl aminopeptidase/acylaminoacyl peptidase
MVQHLHRIPLRDFFRNPDKSGYQLSPSGTFISWLAPFENRMNIHVQDRRDDRTMRITSETDRDIPGHFWKSDSRIVYIKDFSGDENFHIVSVNINGEDLRDLTPFGGVRAQIVDPLEDFDDVMLISLNKRNPELFDVYRLNVITGDLALVAENPGNITGWMTDHTGTLRLAIATDGVNTTLLHRRSETDDFQPVITTNFKESIDPLFFTFDNKHLYASSNLGRDKSAIVVFDLENGKETDVLFEHDDVDASTLSYSRKRKVLTAITYTTWKRERVFLDKLAKNLYQRAAARLSGYEVVIADMSRDEEVMLVRTYSDRSLGGYYLFDMKKDKLTKLSDVSPWLNEKDLAEMKPISYQSRDGLTIHGYLTLPKLARNQPARDLPVVINPHGGPWVRDAWGYNPEVQFLANRGYAVLQVNYRGSTGYGRAFWERSFKQWGRAMQNDISDGVQWLISEGIADPKRVAIYGGSYGGYATLAGLAFTPHLYACGVDYVGVSNLFSFMNTIPPYWKPYLAMMYEMVGSPDTDKELFHAASPVFHVDKIQAPLFVAQGAKDPRVNIEESNQIVEALKKRGIDVPYMVKENEGHGFRNEENRFEFYEAMEVFLAKYLSNPDED